MDTCVCWYHDSDALSCVRVEAAMELLQKYGSDTCLMATVVPRLAHAHKSKIRKYYDDMGFERRRLTCDLNENIEMLVKRHLKYKKVVMND